MISSLSRFFRVREKKLLTEDAEKSRGDRKEKQGGSMAGAGDSPFWFEAQL